MRKLLLSVALMIAPQPALATDDDISSSGNAFYETCKDMRGKDIPMMKFGQCIGFVQGVIRRDEMFSDRHICLPQTSTIGQIIDVIISTLRDNPKVRNYSAAAVVSASLENAWPCNQTVSKP